MQYKMWRGVDGLVIEEYAALLHGHPYPKNFIHANSGESNMHCYIHQENIALGLCKNCQKAVCSVCAKDTGKGLACCSVCEGEVMQMHQIVERSKLIYNIGNKSKLPSSNIIFHFVFGLLFSGFGLLPWLTGGSPEWFLFLIGFGFITFGVFLYFRTRKLNLNC